MLWNKKKYVSLRYHISQLILTQARHNYEIKNSKKYNKIKKIKTKSNQNPIFFTSFTQHCGGINSVSTAA